MLNWYYYLHTNGDLIGKNPIVVDSDPNYFDSPLVRKVWYINCNNRADAWNLVLDCAEMEARPERIKELIAKWGLTKEDSIIFTERTGQKVEEKNGLWIRIN